jgi:hypothetical protein
VETTIPKLTNAAEVLATFDALINDAELRKNPETAELLRGLAQLFIHRPIDEIVDSIENITDAAQTGVGKMFTVYPDGSKERNAALAKQLSLVDDFVQTGELDAANTWLVIGYRAYFYGSKEVAAIVAKGVPLVDAFVNAGMFDMANEWLERGYRTFADGSEERKAVVAKRLSLVEGFVKAGKLDRANDWLATGFHLYPGGSPDEKDVVAKQEQLRQLRSSEQMGAAPKIDIAGLRTIVKQELAKLQVGSVGH